MKITIIGAGNVGASIAYALILRELIDEIILIDINKDLLFARELELSQSIAAFNFDIKITCTDDYTYSKDSQVVIFSAGVARKEGQSRDELFAINSKIMLECAKNIKKFNNDPLFIIVSNPVDFLLNALYESKLFSLKKIIAMAGVLDNARFKYEVSKKLDIKTSYIDTKLIGFHNDSMVLVKSQSKVQNKALSEVLNKQDIVQIEQEVKTGGAKIIKYLKTSAYLAPASACVRMIEALKSGEFLPVCVILDGEYGIREKAFGVMARISLDGVLETLELKLDNQEQITLENSFIQYNYK
ncbi:malate dehydrogenase [Campylobacter lari]|uniref:malate dehydrogenase n=1 Tax=unclassified Campylobacter TaxID=2593542 RepID=UPI0012C9C49B|nr:MULTISPECIES: malate dehydrogenase [unclassified Campylobacter]EAI4448176.1 malate dehydrogenase [Campylobacter lari]EAJ6187299.1 malate dehydrogenase [Campylobacter lari]EAK5535266.1 malate dehydrogenase [Campylobacter lari]EAK9883150.1 malate dehydrogenase [Campylobacter lari]EFB0441375.1 malate dehydrogenase [Campylobacter lari]